MKNKIKNIIRGKAANKKQQVPSSMNKSNSKK